RPHHTEYPQLRDGEPVCLSAPPAKVLWHLCPRSIERHPVPMKISQGTHMTHGTRLFSPRARAAGTVLAAVLPSLVATAAQAGELTIEVSGITANRGKVYIAVYDRPETFPISGHQRVGQVLASEDQHLTVHFKDLPPGQYAAAAFQDFNGN